MKYVLLFLSFILLWLCVSYLFDVPHYIWPTPIAVLNFLYSYQTTLLADLSYTAVSSAISLLFVLGLALLLIPICLIARSFGSLSLLLATLFQTIPILAIAPLLTAWFGPGKGAQIAAAIIVAAPVAIAAAITAIMDITRDELWFAGSVFVGPGRQWRSYLVPRVFPIIVRTARIAAPLCVLGTIVGEFVGSSAGLGFRILSASYYLRTDDMVASLILAVVLSLGLVWTLLQIEHIFRPAGVLKWWKRGVQQVQ